MNNYEKKLDEILTKLRSEKVAIYRDLVIYTRPKELSCFQKNSFIIIEPATKEIENILLKYYPDCKNFGFSSYQLAFIYE